MEFVLNLSEGRTAKVFCGGERMAETTVRPALSDPRIGTTSGPCIIAFKAKRVGDHPLQAEVIPLSKVGWMGRRTNGDAALFLKDGGVVTITVAQEDFLAAQQLLTQLLKNPPTGDQRLFFAKVDDKLALVNAADIRKRTKTPRPDSRESRPPMVDG